MCVSTVFTALSSHCTHLAVFSEGTQSSNTENEDSVFLFFCELLVLIFLFFWVVYNQRGKKHRER